MLVTTIYRYDGITNVLPNGYDGITKVIPLENENENVNRIKDVIDLSLLSSKDLKISKHQYGEYNNVLLTDEEYNKLKLLTDDYKKMIDTLSRYIGSTGKVYKSHYITLRNCFNKDSIILVPLTKHQAIDNI